MNTILGDIYFYPFGCIRESLSIFFSPVLDSCNQVTIARHVMGGFAGVYCRTLSRDIHRLSTMLRWVCIKMKKNAIGKNIEVKHQNMENLGGTSRSHLAKQRDADSAINCPQPTCCLDESFLQLCRLLYFLQLYHLLR